MVDGGSPCGSTTAIIVSSFTFQAPEFYQRYGFVETGRIEGLPLAGTADVQLRKLLVP